MKNIDTAFKLVRGFSILVVLGSFGLGGYSLYKSQQVIASSQQRIYLIANSKAIEAFAADRKDNVLVEARDHVAMFHRYFFTLDPDEKVIASNISKALYLADGSAKRQYDNLKESGYFVNLISGNMSQTINVDSVTVNIEQSPFYFRCYGTQQIIRTSSIVTRSLLTEGYLRSVSRSDNNPHGFLIERWATIQNVDINIRNR